MGSYMGHVNPSLYDKGESKRWTREERVPMRGTGGRRTRSSNEVPVMGMESRGETIEQGC